MAHRSNRTSVILVFTSCALLALDCEPAGQRRADLETQDAYVLVDGTSDASTKSDRSAARCPGDMVEIGGDYCPEVEQTCLGWVDSEGHAVPPPGPGKTGRCGEFRKPSKCLGPKVRKHFCVDTYEFPNVKGQVPRSWMTWNDAKHTCETLGKRLLTRSEWTFACEGPEMLPYPYGDGYHRDRTSCNTDNSVGSIDVFKATSPMTETARRLDALLVPSGSKPGCVSPFGVFDMVGNIDEQVVNETGRPYRSGLMGGHVFGVRNACRPMTEAHGPTFSWYETGFRCAISVDDRDR